MIIPEGKRRYWWIGTASAFLGVAVVRLLAEQLPPDSRPYVRAAGVLLGLGGLFVIMLGTRRKG
jgi:hypothetical protein